MKTIKWMIPLAIAALPLTACSHDSDSQPPSPAASKTQMLEEQRAKEDEVQRLQEEAAAKADRAAEAKALGVLEKQMKTQPTVDDKLDVIVTKFCQVALQPNYSGKLTYNGMNGLFSKYWKSGGQWNAPLGEAAKQKGGCPGYPDVVRDQ